MEERYALHSDIYFHREVLCTTAGGRNVDVVTITDMGNCRESRQLSGEGTFPDKEKPFTIDRPKIVISARVHPGETPSSYCMEGVIRFLLNEKDYRSVLLRRYFHFILIPMINPDGVFVGMFRSDQNGDNLNRHYKHCDPDKQ